MYVSYGRDSVLRLCITCFLLRQLPFCIAVLQTVGQPWPLPQAYLSGTNVQSLNSNSFQFRVVGKDCDILQAAIVRYFKIVFRTTTDGKAAPLTYDDDVLRFQPKERRGIWAQEQENEAGAGLALGGLDVEVGQACAELYPSLDMDESCMYTTRMLLRITVL